MLGLAYYEKKQTNKQQRHYTTALPDRRQSWFSILSSVSTTAQYGMELIQKRNGISTTIDSSLILHWTSDYHLGKTTTMLPLHPAQACTSAVLGPNFS
jgi:hypothetical protein